MDVPVCLWHNKSNIGGMFQTDERITSLTIFSAEGYWDLICVNAISAIVRNSFLVPIQISVRGFFWNCSFKFESLESSANSSWALSGRWSISLKPFQSGFWIQIIFWKSIFNIKYVRNCISGALKWSTIICTMNFLDYKIVDTGKNFKIIFFDPFFQMLIF